MSSMELFDLNNFLRFCCATKLKKYFKITEDPPKGSNKTEGNFSVLGDLDAIADFSQSETPRDSAQEEKEDQRTENEIKFELSQQILEFVNSTMNEVILDFFMARFNSSFRKLKGSGNSRPAVLPQRQSLFQRHLRNFPEHESRLLQETRET